MHSPWTSAAHHFVRANRLPISLGSNRTIVVKTPQAKSYEFIVVHSQKNDDGDRQLYLLNKNTSYRCDHDEDPELQSTLKSLGSAVVRSGLNIAACLTANLDQLRDTWEADIAALPFSSCWNQIEYVEGQYHFQLCLGANGFHTEYAADYRQMPSQTKVTEATDSFRLKFLKDASFLIAVRAYLNEALTDHGWQPTCITNSMSVTFQFDNNQVEISPDQPAVVSAKADYDKISNMVRQAIQRSRPATTAAVEELILEPITSSLNLA